MKHVLHKIRHFVGLGKSECEVCWPGEKKAHAAKPKAKAKANARRKKR